MSPTPRRSRPPVPVPVLTSLLATVVAGALAACGGGGAEPAPSPSTVFVTVQPSEAAPAAPSADPSAEASAASSGEPSSEPSPEPSGDPAALPALRDRSFDVVLVAEREDTVDGTVLTFDRLTVAGVDDGDLAAEGTEVRLDDGEVFSNQTERFYEVGVSPDARFFLTTCTDDGSGPSISSEPVDLDTFLAAPGLDGTAVSLEYTEGLLVRAETNPRC